MLAVLRRIAQETNAAHSMLEMLKLFVYRIREAMNIEACSIFLVDERLRQFVLMATDGLNTEQVGKLRFDFNQGLVGMIAAREESLNIEDAALHPHFLRLPEIQEEALKAFLGVPIVHQRRVLGVLVVQQTKKRYFDEMEESFVITVAAQLAGVIAHAEVTGELARLLRGPEFSQKSTEEQSVTGIASVGGIAIGQIIVIYPQADLNAVPDRITSDIAGEITLFQQALAKARADVSQLAARLAPTLPPEEQNLFQAYQHILDSSSLSAEVIAEINTGQWAQSALRRVIKRHTLHFENLEDEYLRERAVDLRDLGRRILAHLQENQLKMQHYPEATVLIGEEVTAARLAEVPEGCLAGIVSVKGSSYSHAAILARALGIPTIMGANGLSLTDLENKEVIVDGYAGQVYITPSEHLKREFQELQLEEQTLNAELQALRGLPAETLDGYRIQLHVNAGLAADASRALSIGAEGVGLYRTEVPFMTRDFFPTEEEQRVIYRQLLNAFAPRPVVMRLLDIGGDKILPYFKVSEANPYLGWRGIRVILDHPEVFLVQTRAMLKANAGLNNLRILLPMITSVNEVNDALLLLKKAYQEVQEEGYAVSMPAIGVMIEVPSAVYQIAALAKRVDFFSVGSNDLTQYLLAVDRNNPYVANLYDGLHPAMLILFKQLIDTVHQHNKKISICGEIASDPAAAMLLVALGFDGLSMNAASLLRIKWVIRSFNHGYLQSLLAEVMTYDDSIKIRFHLEQVLNHAGLGGLIRAGK